MNYQLIINDKIWRAFKSACAKSGKPMAAVLRELIVKFINSYRDPEEWE